MDVDEIKNSDNLKAVISKRKYDGAYTFAISRVYTTDSQEEKSTAFVPEYLLRSYMQLLETVEARIKALRDEGARPHAAGAR